MKLFIIPGSGEKIDDSGYKNILKAAEHKGHNTEVLNVQLRQQNIAKVLDNAAEVVRRSNPSKVAIFGFSSGALVAHTTTLRQR